jgi:hypothetical protein
VTRFYVDVHEVTHTCPADPTPHPIDIRHSLVLVVDEGPCHAPTTVGAGERARLIACARTQPWHRQCDACRSHVEVRNTTRTHTGADVQPDRAAPAGYAPHPCRVCGQRLAAVLADAGRHLLCDPATVWAGRR